MRDKIIQLARKGYGRRRIAQELGISEWRVRTELRALSTKSTVMGATPSGHLVPIQTSPITVSKNKLKKAVVLNDLHVPYHSEAAVAIALQYIKDEKPDKIVLNGDIVDFYGVSSYSKDPLRLNTLQDEVDAAAGFFHTLREIVGPDTEIVYIKGNHEDRLERFLLDKAPSLCSLNCLALDELLLLAQYDIRFVDVGIHLGDLEIVHGFVARKNPGASAKAYYEKSCSSILIGHVHRLNITYFKNKFGQHCLVENGCLCGLDPDYTHSPNWQNGFSTVYYDEGGGFFEVFLHHIKENKMAFQGKIYEA